MYQTAAEIYMAQILSLRFIITFIIMLYHCLYHYAGIRAWQCNVICPISSQYESLFSCFHVPNKHKQSCAEVKTPAQDNKFKVNLRFYYSRSVRSRDIFLSLLSTEPTLTLILSPRLRNSSTLFILLFAIFEICKSPSRPGKILTKAP